MNNIRYKLLGKVRNNTITKVQDGLHYKVRIAVWRRVSNRVTNRVTNRVWSKVYYRVFK